MKPITILQPMHTNLKLELLNIMILSSQGQVKIGMNYYCQQHPNHQFSLKCPLIQKQNVKYMHPTSSWSSSLFCLYNIKIKIKIKNTSGDDLILKEEDWLARSYLALVCAPQAGGHLTGPVT